jgi:hypothetical protein
MASPQRKTLDEVIASAAKSAPTNQRARVEKYEAACEQLIASMREWLQPQVQTGIVKTAQPNQYFDLSEQGYRYQAAGWTFSIGAQQIHLQPRGTWVIGAFGRMDMRAQPGSLVVLTLNENFQWELPTRGKTKVRYSKLDDQSFPEALDRALTIS